VLLVFINTNVSAEALPFVQSHSRMNQLSHGVNCSPFTSCDSVKCTRSFSVRPSGYISGMKA
jgi:hypothetical protein